MNTGVMSSYSYHGGCEPISQYYPGNLDLKEIQDYDTITDFYPSSTTKSVDYSLMPPLERIEDFDSVMPTPRSQDHPKKKLRIAYDREVAESNDYDAESMQSISYAYDAFSKAAAVGAAVSGADKSLSNNRASSDNCCLTKASSLMPSIMKRLTLCEIRQLRNQSPLYPTPSEFNFPPHPPPPDLIPMNHVLPNAISASFTPPRSVSPECPNPTLPQVGHNQMFLSEDLFPKYPKIDINEQTFPVVFQASPKNRGVNRSYSDQSELVSANKDEQDSRNSWNQQIRSLSGGVRAHSSSDDLVYTNNSYRASSQSNGSSEHVSSSSSSSIKSNKQVQDQPEDLRVSNNERLKDVARGIFIASTIPLLNCKDIPSVLQPEDLKQNGQRMSTDTLRHSFPKNPRDLAKSPSCGVSCSSNFQDPYSPSHPHPSNFNSLQGAPSTYRNKEGSWNDIEGPRHHSHPHSIPHHKPLPRPPPPQPQHRYPESVQYSDQEKIGQPEDSKDYLRKPIEAWSYADVIYFLMDACKEIRIDPNEVQFKSSDNGSALLRMSPSDFDILSANNGQKLYDYFIKFKTQHYLISECQSARPSYNYGGPYPPPLQEPYSPCNDHPNGQASGYQDHYHQYPDYHHHQGSPYGSPGYHHPPDSPSQEYVPQGAQYSSHHDHHAFHSPDDHHGRYHEIPSAAGKTFAPLHNYDDPTSDPDESEDEKPPEPPKKRGPGRPPKPENERKRKAKKTGRLWEFIRNLLLDPKTCPSLVRWEDPTEGVFRIVQSDVIANKWGMRKNNEKMNYEKLSRAMRYYYKAKIFEPVLGKRLVYKFGANAKGWRPLHADNPNFQNGV